MTKQQETIREMASKKLLNGEQKRVLYRLFEAKITALKTKFEGKISSMRGDFQDELIRKAKKSPSISKILTEIERANKLIASLEDKLKEAGYKLGYRDELELTYDNKEHRKWEDDNEAKLKKIEDLKAKLLSDIYCLPMTADEMTSYVEDEIEKINKL